MVTKDAVIRRTPPLVVATETLDDGDRMAITPAEESALDAVELQGIYTEGASDLYILVDADEDGIYENSVQFVTTNANEFLTGIDNQLLAAGMQFIVEDTSGGADNDVIVTGKLQ